MPEASGAAAPAAGRRRRNSRIRLSVYQVVVVSKRGAASRGCPMHVPMTLAPDTTGSRCW